MDGADRGAPISRTPRVAWFIWRSSFVVLAVWGLLWAWRGIPTHNVELRWRTDSEENLVGFHLYRGSSPDGPWTQLNEAPLPARGDSLSGAVYTYTDRPVRGASFYRIEELFSDGSRRALPPVRVNGGGAWQSVLPGLLLGSVASFALWWGRGR